MNNFLSRFYFFSKFTTSLILLILLIILSYLFVKAYLDQSNSNNGNVIIEDLSNQITNLANIVEKNSSNLRDVKNLVQDNKKSVKDISISLENFNSNQISDNLLLHIDTLFKENKILQDKIYNILSTVENIENVQTSSLQDNDSLIPINNVIKLIKLKLDNGSNFVKEVELLGDFIINAEYSSNVDKLSIYATKQFPGLDILNSNFDNISSSYLNDYYLEKSNNYFFKHFINLFLIQPNLNKNIEDKNVLVLSLAKHNLLDKNLNESIKLLNTLNNGEHYFSIWIEQAKYYDRVIDLLNKI